MVIVIVYVEVTRFEFNITLGKNKISIIFGAHHTLRIVYFPVRLHKNLIHQKQKRIQLDNRMNDDFKNKRKVLITCISKELYLNFTQKERTVIIYGFYTDVSILFLCSSKMNV